MEGNYSEAIKCLQEHYDWPRLIHQAHVHAILEAPPIKDGRMKELRHLHNMLKCFDTFIAASELKFNQSAMCEWQKFSQDWESVHLYSELLRFLDLEAREAENTAMGDSERRRSVAPPGKKTILRPSYPVNVNEMCMGCKQTNHPLYICKMFQALSYKLKMGVVKNNKLRLSRLGSGHFVKECPSGQKCKKCHQPHHSWLHIDAKSEDCKASTPVKWARTLEHQWTW